ncbi:MAG TPA: tRNA (N6-threonylcarbamoyladenosine(37)-N6)-methyltransferase TrmO [Methanobacterium sp.]|nr:tRNA (N6-threonylcarbamoyladenosine(37)-N6)-methyltransferase TrmO [Methanobacterium sp.]
MDVIQYTPIGIIKSPFKECEGMPIQPIGACGIKGEIHLNKEYEEGLEDIQEFSHIILIYHLHLCEGFSLKVKPFMDDKKHGIFATRAPKRPNPIGLSVVRLDKVVDNIIYIENVDILDGTPLLDIKPYIPQVERNPEDEVCIGWFEENHHKASDMKADDRFTK